MKWSQLRFRETIEQTSITSLKPAAEIARQQVRNDPNDASLIQPKTTSG